MVTMQDVARFAGVSAKTVSRVFRGDPHVGQETRERVIDAMQHLKYTPNMLARTFREGRILMIAVAVPSVSDPFFAQAVAAIEMVARGHNVGVVIASLGEDPDDEEDIVTGLLQRQFAGLILAPIGHSHHYLTPWLGRIPMVFIDREPVGIDADYFIEDDEYGASMAVEHLIELGHKDIAFLGNSTQVVTTKRRFVGYARCLAQYDIHLRDELVIWASVSHAIKVLAEAIAVHNFSAVFSSNSLMTQAIFPMFQATAASKALVGFGDFPMSESLLPAVSVIDQNPSRMGKLAAERIFERIHDPDGEYPRHNVMKVCLIRRGET